MNGNNKRLVLIGIDCGINGAIAAIDEKFNVLGLEDTPIIKAGGKSLYNVAEMSAILRRYALLGDPFVIVGKAQVILSQGVTDILHTGFGFGLWCGILGALEISAQIVMPSVWKQDILKGCPGEGKTRAIGFVTRMFPTAELIPVGCRTPHDGRVEALFLAYCGVKK